MQDIVAIMKPPWQFRGCTTSGPDTRSRGGHGPRPRVWSRGFGMAIVVATPVAAALWALIFWAIG